MAGAESDSLISRRRYHVKNTPLQLRDTQEVRLPAANDRVLDQNTGGTKHVPWALVILSVIIRICKRTEDHTSSMDCDVIGCLRALNKKEFAALVERLHVKGNPRVSFKKLTVNERFETRPLLTALEVHLATLTSAVSAPVHEDSGLLVKHSYSSTIIRPHTKKGDLKNAHSFTSKGKTCVSKPPCVSKHREQHIGF